MNSIIHAFEHTSNYFNIFNFRWNNNTLIIHIFKKMKERKLTKSEDVYNHYVFVGKSRALSERKTIQENLISVDTHSHTYAYAYMCVCVIIFVIIINRFQAAAGSQICVCIYIFVR